MPREYAWEKDEQALFDHTMGRPEVLFALQAATAVAALTEWRAIQERVLKRKRGDGTLCLQGEPLCEVCLELNVGRPCSRAASSWHVHYWHGHGYVARHGYACETAGATECGLRWRLQGRSEQRPQRLRGTGSSVGLLSFHSRAAT